MPLDPGTGEWLKLLEQKYGERRRQEYSSERATVTVYFQEVAKRLAGTYALHKPLAVGGTGIVVTGTHERFTQPVVVKFNRPNVPHGERSMVANEAGILPSLNHPNIIRVLDLGELPLQGATLTYLVEPFVSGSKPLFTFDKEKVDGTWLKKRLDDARASLPATPHAALAADPGIVTAIIKSLLADLASIFAQWISLLAHLHNHRTQAAQNGYVYLDVKAENVLVDEHGHLTSIDYGSVEALDDSDDSPVEVFFTERYAHPLLVERKKERASSNRVRGAMKRNELRREFDYYALGSSMLEILNAVAEVRPHVVPQLPLYRSLHFLATRLLDGQNRGRESDNHYHHAPQVFPGLREEDYSDLGYTNLDDTDRDLKKERGQWNLEDEVPELATYSKDIVRLVPGFNTVLTSRLRGVMEHPIVARLKYVTQLGLVSLVYPTADHSRYDHALGSYTYTTNYVKSLFNDLGNPLFRNLVAAEDLNAVLLAALLHDLGQYPLAHDLEEVHDRIFKHVRIGMELLEDTTCDLQGRTLKDVVSDAKNGWGVKPQLLSDILGAHSGFGDVDGSVGPTSLKTDVLAAIIDGPVDADKADYIIRDSSRCELPYGHQLDLERLLRVLTVAIIPDEAVPRKRVTLGVYDKGLVSAHAFGQARYQLLASVYWHHTARIAKAMLQFSTAMSLPGEVFGYKTPERERREVELREQLLAFLKSLVPPFDLPKERSGRPGKPAVKLDLTAEPPAAVLESLADADALGADSMPSVVAKDWCPGIAWTDWLMLSWLGDLPAASTRSRNLIRGLRTRMLYKRIATFIRGANHDRLIDALEELSWPDKVDLCEKLHKRVYEKLRRDWRNVDTATWMQESEFESLCDSTLLVLIDVPRPSKKVGYDRPLGVVPELKEKSYQQASRQATEDKRWRDTMERMIEAIGPVRVLCHPDVRNIVSSLYAPVELSMARELEALLGVHG